VLAVAMIVLVALLARKPAGDTVTER